MKKPFGRALTPLINHLMQTDLQIAPALDFWQKQLGLGESQPTNPMDQTFDAVNLGSLAFQESVVDTPTVTTRAGTYVYLNALVRRFPNPSLIWSKVSSFMRGHHSKMQVLYTTLMLGIRLDISQSYGLSSNFNSS